jgi:ribosomal protein S27AE
MEKRYTCGDCFYAIYQKVKGDEQDTFLFVCHANPPAQSADVIDSIRPVVQPDDPPCRFFEEKKPPNYKGGVMSDFLFDLSEPYNVDGDRGDWSDTEGKKQIYKLIDGQIKRKCPYCKEFAVYVENTKKGLALTCGSCGYMEDRQDVCDVGGE